VAEAIANGVAFLIPGGLGKHATEFDFAGACGLAVGFAFAPAPKDHIEVLRPVALARYGPLQANGEGKQGAYFTELTPAFAETLAGLISAEAEPFLRGVAVGAPVQTNDDLDWWEQVE
jgi:hypothetical protein